MTENNSVIQSPTADFERRKYPRVSFVRPCWCESLNITMLTKISNISRGGVFLKTSNPFPIGNHAILTFRPVEAKEGNEITMEVEVVWYSRGPRLLHKPGPSGMGTRLLKIIKGENLFKDSFNRIIRL